ncbi:DUF6188 family protein [Mycobacterium sp. NPDC050551]|uniref:DUF6188 family protein n=1 Tax=Mycobacterium sp. NPDC050551 TaxID=3155407 RepID=UPI003422F0E0
MTTDLRLCGRTVTSVHVEYTLQVRLSDTYNVTVESPFRFHLSDRSVELSPEADPDKVRARLSRLVGHRIVDARVSEAGALTIGFDDSTRLTVEPDPNYEAWNVSGPAGFLVVCVPGGELAIWTGS